jgi:glutathione synthase/RimK-type ligase-like ATP-grasp enzyme
LSEWSALLDGIYSELSGRWLNEPHLTDQAEDKVRQLRVATSIGLLVPRTIISNDPTRIASFVAQYPSVAKPLRNGVIDGAEQPDVIFTNRISTLSELDGPAIEAVPIIVQREIPKAADIRVTIVGRRVFATAIQSQADESARVDWRRGDVVSMIHVTHDLPPDTAVRCIEVVKALGLKFGAIDLVLYPKGRYWFLEINPNGQWGWIQNRTDQPIARAIVDELLEISGS